MSGSVYEWCANPEHWRRPKHVAEIRLYGLKLEIPLCNDCRDLLQSNYDSSSGTQRDPFTRFQHPRNDNVQ